MRWSILTLFDELEDVLGLLAPGKRLGDGRQEAELFGPLLARLALASLVIR